MPSPRTPSKSRLAGFEHLEAREVPAALPLADLNPVPAASFPLPYGAYTDGRPTGAVVGGSVLFAAADGANAAAVWKSDGTAAGTKLVAALPSATPDGSASPWNQPGPFTAAGGKAFFTYADGPGSPAVWVSDGTAAGTKKVAAPAGAGDAVSPQLVGAAGGRVLVAADQIVPEVGAVKVLWSTDGTAAGTALLKDLGYVGFPNFTPGDNALYFATQSDTTLDAVTTLWKTDGTAAGTKAVVALPVGVSLNFSYPTGTAMAAVGNTLYFAAYDEGHGTELWATDGTAAGTRLVKDINPNSGTVGPWLPQAPTFPYGSDPGQFVARGGKLYFAADDGEHGRELWVSDGTEAGTAMVTDLSPTVRSLPGPAYMYPTAVDGSRIAGLRVHNGKLLFAADDGEHGPQVYSSDGTAAGTAALTSIPYVTQYTPAPFPGDPPLALPDPMPVIFSGGPGGTLVFGAGDSSSGPRFGVTDGTPAGTTVATPSAFTGPVPLGVSGGKLLFHADGADGRQLRATDGTAAGTATVARINPNTLGSTPRSFTAVSDTLAVFVGTAGPGWAATLYATDGASAPKPIKAFDQPVPGLTGVYAGTTDRPDQLTRAGGRVLFVAKAGNVGRQLWSTDGTAAGTKLLKEFALPESGLYGMYAGGVDNLTAAGAGAYFTVDLPGVGQQLWKTDGTAAGTALVKAIHTGSSQNTPNLPPVRQLTAVGAAVYFLAGDGAGWQPALWKSDGTAAGTKAVAGIVPAGGVRPVANLTALGGKLVFSADSEAGAKLYVTDGTAAGTKALAAYSPSYGNPYNPSGDGISARGLVAAGGKLYFANRDDAGTQLWVTDGTAAGTKRVSNLPALTLPYTNDPGVTGITAVGGKVYFTAQDPAAGWQLYVSDGTAAETKMVKAIGAGAKADPSGLTGAAPAAVLAVGDRLVFAAADPDHGRELWVTDGTAAGTKLVADALPGRRSGVGTGWYAGPGGAAAVNGRVVFPADTGPTGAEPWAVSFADLGITTTTPTPTPTPGTKPTAVSVAKVNATEGTSGLFTLGTVRLPAGPAYKVWVFWGDKLASAGALTRTTPGGTTFTVTATHAYAAPGAYKLQFRITVDEKAVLTVDTTATVTAARFYVNRVAERATAGRAFLGPVATIKTTNPSGGQAGDFTATIDWGDGTKSAGTVRKTAAGSF